MAAQPVLSADIVLADCRTQHRTKQMKWKHSNQASNAIVMGLHSHYGVMKEKKIRVSPKWLIAVASLWLEAVLSHLDVGLKRDK